MGVGYMGMEYPRYLENTACYFSWMLRSTSEVAAQLTKRGASSLDTLVGNIISTWGFIWGFGLLLPFMVIWLTSSWAVFVIPFFYLSWRINHPYSTLYFVFYNSLNWLFLIEKKTICKLLQGNLVTNIWVMPCYAQSRLWDNWSLSHHLFMVCAPYNA